MHITNLRKVGGSVTMIVPPAVLDILHLQAGATAGFAVSLASTGTSTTGVIHCDQPRALDLEARAGRKLETVPAAISDGVLAKLAPLFD